MCAIHTELVTDKHAYTRSRVPWLLDEHGSTCGKLVFYISGGGMRAFGRTIRQEEVRLRHRRFYLVSAVIAVVWTVFLFV